MQTFTNTHPMTCRKLVGPAGNFGTPASPGFSGSSSVAPLITLDNQNKFVLSDFELSNCDYAALLLKNGAFQDMAGFVDRFNIHDAYIGIKTESSGEYASFGMGSVHHCTIGLHCSSGNNKFVGTSFTKNKFGVFMYQGTNDAHGVMDGITANHNETNIACWDIVIGQVFNGGACFGGYNTTQGKIDIQRSKNILINGMHIGSNDITVDSSSELILRNVLWHGNINVTIAPGGVFDAKNCYKHPNSTLTLNGIAWSGNN